MSINIKFTMDLILKYFPDLTEEQKRQFAALYDLYLDWNSKINVISRKDIENLYEHHVLHSLGIAKVIHFRPGTQIMDLGTGGGFPGIPLAILFPEVHFHLVDSIGKKVRVASEIANSIGLKNITFRHARAEEEKGKFDFVVSRDATDRPTEDYPQEHLLQTAECIAQRTDLPQGGRIGKRNHARQEQDYAVGPEGVL